MLKFLGLGLLLQCGHLPSIVENIAFFLFEDFDFIKTGLELLVERVDVAEVLVLSEFFLALFELLLQHQLLVLKTLNFLESLVLDAEERFLPFTHLFLEHLLLVL